MLIDDGLEDLIESTVASARREVFLCAPFVKIGVMARLLDCVREGVLLNLVTRWRPEEVAAGVSDPAVRTLIEDRGGAVWLHDRLHAKLYRADDTALVGSANLTATALGSRLPANIEVLIALHASETIEFERRLCSEAVRATEEIEMAVTAVAVTLPQGVPDAAESNRVGWMDWLPRLRQPSELFSAYSRGPDVLSSGSAEAARHDLATIDVMPGLSQPAFDSVVGLRLMSMPMVKDVDRFVSTPRRFGEVRDFLRVRLDIDREQASFEWQTLIRWLMYFRPDRYQRSVRRWTEVISRKGEVHVGV